jgi:hypothetical protein
MPRVNRATGLVRAVVGVALPLAAALTACDGKSLLTQEDPGQIAPGTLDLPESAGLLVSSAVGAYECALASYIVAAGLMGDELIDAQTSPTYWEFDRRTVRTTSPRLGSTACGQGVGVYLPLSMARFQADDAVRRLAAMDPAAVPDRSALIATAAAAGGYSLVLLGEGMCSAAIDRGAELSRAQLEGQAEERFTRAIEAGTEAGRQDLVALALVGRARARLNQGKLAEARADADLVPAGFRYEATYSAASPRRLNLVYTTIVQSAWWTVDPSFRGLQVGAAPDPRVDVADLGIKGQDRSTPIWWPRKYDSPAARIPIARWEEAQLIIAEVDGGAAALGRLNGLRSAAGLPPLGPLTDPEIEAAVREERRRILFLEGQRLGDINRLSLALIPAPGTRFHLGGVYGNQRCFPLPDAERDNNDSFE